MNRLCMHPLFQSKIKFHHAMINNKPHSNYGVLVISMVKYFLSTKISVGKILTVKWTGFPSKWKSLNIIHKKETFMIYDNAIGRKQGASPLLKKNLRTLLGRYKNKKISHSALPFLQTKKK